MDQVSSSDQVQDLSLKNTKKHSVLVSQLEAKPKALDVLAAKVTQSADSHKSANEHAAHFAAVSTLSARVPAEMHQGDDSNKRRDETYLSKRQRNNIAAQRSRQKKRLLDMEKEERMKQLEIENEQLKRRVAENSATATTPPLRQLPLSHAPEFQDIFNLLSNQQHQTSPRHPTLSALSAAASTLGTTRTSELCGTPSFTSATHSTLATMPQGAAASHPLMYLQQHNDLSVVQSTSVSSHSSDASSLLRLQHHLSPPTDVQNHAPLLDSLLRLPIIQQRATSVEPFTAQQAPSAHMALLQALLHNNNAPPHNYTTYSHSTNSSASDQSAMLISPASTVHSDDNEQLNHNSSSASSTHDEPRAKRRAIHLSTNDKEAATSPENDISPGDELSRYRQRRARNNEAARKCRANRRLLVEQRQKRADELALENEQLKEQVTALKLELARLHDHVKQRATHTTSLAHTPDDSS